MENEGRAIQLNIQHNPSLMNQFPTSVSLMVASTIDSTISILCEVAFTNDSTGPTGFLRDSMQENIQRDRLIVAIVNATPGQKNH